MSENMKAFLEAASKNEEMKEKLKATTDKEALIALANECGFALTEADLTSPEGELSEDELAAVAGGDSGGCICVLAGGGGGKQTDDDTYGCACVGYGQGGDGSIDDFTCWCTGYGNGVFPFDNNMI